MHCLGQTATYIHEHVLEIRTAQQARSNAQRSVFAVYLSDLYHNSAGHLSCPSTDNSCVNSSARLHNRSRSTRAFTKGSVQNRD